MLFGRELAVQGDTAAILAQGPWTSYNHASVYSVSLFEATNVGAYMFSNLPHAFSQNDQDLLYATVVTQGWNRYPNKSAQKVDPREEFFPNGTSSFV